MKKEVDILNYYDILEISPNASNEVLKKAYHSLAQKYDPQKFNSSYKQYASQQTKLLNEAYRILSDPQERRRFDVKLAESTRITPQYSNNIFFLTLKVLIVATVVFFIGWYALTTYQTAAISPTTKVIMLVLMILFLFILFRNKIFNPPKRP